MKDCAKLHGEISGFLLQLLINAMERGRVVHSSKAAAGETFTTGGIMEQAGFLVRTLKDFHGHEWPSGDRLSVNAYGAAAMLIYSVARELALAGVVPPVPVDYQPFTAAECDHLLQMLNCCDHAEMPVSCPGQDVCDSCFKKVHMWAALAKKGGRT